MPSRLYTFLWIIVLLVVSIGVAWGGYFYFFGTTTLTPPTAENNRTYGTLFPTTADVPGAASQTATGRAVPRATSTSSTNGATSSATSSAVLDEEGESVFQVVLRQMTTLPIGGYSMLSKGGSTTFHYIERGMGRVHEIGIKETIPRLLSNTTITKVQESLWNDTGISAIIRSFTGDDNTIETLLATLVRATSSTQTNVSGEMKGGVLPATVTSVAVSPDKKSIFYLNKAGNGVIGLTSDFSNKNQKQVFDSLFTEWNVDWPSAHMIALTTKPSAFVPGSLYILNPTTKSGRFLISNVKGLTAKMSPNGLFGVYSMSTQAGFITYFYSVADGTTDSFPITALPEKCVWSSKNQYKLWCAAPEVVAPNTYPEAWYMGNISFDDTLWEINIQEGSAKIVSSPTKEFRVSPDMVNLALNGDESVLSFIDKTTGTLWAFQITP